MDRDKRDRSHRFGSVGTLVDNELGPFCVGLFLVLAQPPLIPGFDFRRLFRVDRGFRPRDKNYLETEAVIL